MFYVYSKEPESSIDEVHNTRRRKKVYDIQYKNGYPFFTFYEDGRWIIRSAKYYVPVEN